MLAAERGEGSNAPVIAPFRRQEKVRAFSGTTHKLRQVVSSGERQPQVCRKVCASLDIRGWSGTV